MRTEICLPHARLRFALLAIGLAVAACGGEDPAPNLPGSIVPPPAAPPVAVPEPTTLRERLERGLSISLASGSPGFEIEVKTPDGVARTATAGTAMQGAASVAIDDRGRLGIGDFAIDVGDVVIGAETFPPYGLHLAGIIARITRAKFEPEWMAGRQGAHFVGPASMRVDWVLVGHEGNRIPLRPIDIDALAVEGSIEEDDAGQAVLKLTGHASGVLLRVAEIVELSELRFALGSR